MLTCRRLKRFIRRELDYREGEGQIPPGQIAIDDVLSEAIADALGEQRDRPERMKLEPWLYRLAKRAIDRLSSEDREQRPIVEENVIPDPTANTPEELAARRELIAGGDDCAMPDATSRSRSFCIPSRALRWKKSPTSANHTVEEVRAAIRKARDHLQRALPIKDPLKDKLVEYSKSA